MFHTSWGPGVINKPCIQVLNKSLSIEAPITVKCQYSWSACCITMCLMQIKCTYCTWNNPPTLDSDLILASLSVVYIVSEQAIKLLIQLLDAKRRYVSYLNWHMLIVLIHISQLLTILAQSLNSGLRYGHICTSILGLVLYTFSNRINILSANISLYGTCRIACSHSELCMQWLDFL